MTLLRISNIHFVRERDGVHFLGWHWYVMRLYDSNYTFRRLSVKTHPSQSRHVAQPPSSLISRCRMEHARIPTETITEVIPGPNSLVLKMCRALNRRRTVAPRHAYWSNVKLNVESWIITHDAVVSSALVPAWQYLIVVSPKPTKYQRTATRSSRCTSTYLRI